jgi:hypothetical protein
MLDVYSRRSSERDKPHFDFRGLVFGETRMPRENRARSIFEEDKSAPRVLMAIPCALVQTPTNVWLDVTGRRVFKRD